MSASARAMRALLSDLGAAASQWITIPAPPESVMRAFVKAMSQRRHRPIELMFRAFPADLGVSGLRLDFGDRSVIVVEERAAPAAQLVILGHELFHEEQGKCGHHLGGSVTAAAARSLSGDDAASILQRAVEQIVAAEEIPREALLAVAARARSSDSHEEDAERFGLFFGLEVRTWVTGPYAQGAVSSASLEGRINRSLGHRGGRLI
ncbi:toxin [Streptomyces pilosus]|uniref:toxin n=1 Tax=Streptomyces pilosus TaxID=28893 RepID=UPI0036355F2B